MFCNFGMDPNDGTFSYSSNYNPVYLTLIKCLNNKGSHQEVHPSDNFHYSISSQIHPGKVAKVSGYHTFK